MKRSDWSEEHSAAIAADARGELLPSFEQVRNAPRGYAEVKIERQSGQGMVEYALILVLVSIVVIVILLTMGGQIQNVFSNVVAALNA